VKERAPLSASASDVYARHPQVVDFIAETSAEEIAPFKCERPCERRTFAAI